MVEDIGMSMSDASGGAKKTIESLKIVFAGTNIEAANLAMDTLHQLTPEHFRSEITTTQNGDDSLRHMEFKCYGLTETSFKNAVTAHIWCPQKANPLEDTWDKLMKDANGLAFFLTPDFELAKLGLAEMDAVLKRNGSELNRTPLLILPPPGDDPFEPMAQALDRPVRNLFDSDPDSGYRLFLAVRILINRNLPEQPKMPPGMIGQYNYQHKPPQSSLLSGGEDEGADLFLPPDDAITRGGKKSTVSFSDDAPEGERRRGLFGRLIGKKKGS
jgi:hypothetical protein